MQHYPKDLERVFRLKQDVLVPAGTLFMQARRWSVAEANRLEGPVSIPGLSTPPRLA